MSSKIDFLRAKGKAALAAELAAEVGCSRCAPGTRTQQGLCADHARLVELELRDRREFEAAVNNGTFKGTYWDWRDQI